MNGTSTAKRKKPLGPITVGDDDLAVQNADELVIRIRRFTTYATRPGRNRADLIRESNDVRELLGLLDSYVDSVLS